MQGASFLLRQAQVLAAVGERAEAIATLERLLKIPAEISTVALSADPGWTALRDEPQFQEFIGKTPHKDTLP